MQRLVHGRGECGEGAKAGGSLEEGEGCGARSTRHF